MDYDTIEEFRDCGAKAREALTQVGPQPNMKDVMGEGKIINNDDAKFMMNPARPEGEKK